MSVKQVQSWTPDWVGNELPDQFGDGKEWLVFSLDRPVGAAWRENVGDVHWARFREGLVCTGRHNCTGKAAVLFREAGEPWRGRVLCDQCDDEHISPNTEFDRPGFEPGLPRPSAIGILADKAKTDRARVLMEAWAKGDLTAGLARKTK